MTQESSLLAIDEPLSEEDDRKPNTATSSLKLAEEVSVRIPRIGDLIEGTVVAKEPSTIFIDLGIIGTGIIFGREFSLARDFIKGISMGDTVRAKVTDQENDDGYVELSLQEAGRDMAWQRLREKMTSRESFTVSVANANRGGLVANVEGVQAFIPVSQLSVEHYPRVEGGDKEKILQELQKLINKPLLVQVLDLDPGQEKLILSEKLAEQTSTLEKLKQHRVGDLITGTVSGVVDFGVFIKFGEDKDLEGLAHISELDWQLIDDPRQLFKPGDDVKAKIIGLDRGKVSLSLKALKKDPWDDSASKFTRGDIVDGQATRYNPFGVFVEVAHGIQGLVHIAEFRSSERMREEIKLGETYKFRIAALEPKEHRMSLKPARDEEPAHVPPEGEARPKDGPPESPEEETPAKPLEFARDFLRSPLDGVYSEHGRTAQDKPIAVHSEKPETDTPQEES